VPPKTTPRSSDLIPLWPRLTRFYGIPPHELQGYPAWLVSTYVDAMPGLEAEEQLLRAAAADSPHLEEHDRRNVRRQLMSMIDSEPEPSEVPDISTEAGKSTLQGMGIGVRVGKREENDG
jgi:hypothetical protein